MRYTYPYGITLIHNYQAILYYLSKIISSQSLIRTDWKIINHYLVKDWTIIERKHNEFIKQGYDGLILRNPNKKYGKGLKSSLYMIEMTSYKSKDFKITGYGKGLKPEDMYFICENILYGKNIVFKKIGSANNKSCI